MAAYQFYLVRSTLLWEGQWFPFASSAKRTFLLPETLSLIKLDCPDFSLTRISRRGQVGRLPKKPEPPFPHVRSPSPVKVGPYVWSILNPADVISSLSIISYSIQY